MEPITLQSINKRAQERQQNELLEYAAIAKAFGGKFKAKEAFENGKRFQRNVVRCDEPKTIAEGTTYTSPTLRFTTPQNTFRLYGEFAIFADADGASLAEGVIEQMARLGIVNLKRAGGESREQALASMFISHFGARQGAAADDDGFASRVPHLGLELSSNPYSFSKPMDAANEGDFTDLEILGLLGTTLADSVDDTINVTAVATVYDLVNG